MVYWSTDNLSWLGKESQSPYDISTKYIFWTRLATDKRECHRGRRDLNFAKIRNTVMSMTFRPFVLLSPIFVFIHFMHSSWFDLNVKIVPPTGKFDYITVTRYAILLEIFCYTIYVMSLNKPSSSFYRREVLAVGLDQILRIWQFFAQSSSYKWTVENTTSSKHLHLEIFLLLLLRLYNQSAKGIHGKEIWDAQKKINLSYLLATKDKLLRTLLLYCRQ